MNTQFDFDQLLDSWLADGPSELPDQAVSRIVQSIDDNERRLSWLPRRETMNRLVVAAGSVAAVVLVAVIGFGIVSGGGTSGPGAAPSPTPTPMPSATQLTEGDVEPGRYFHEIDGYRYTFTVPESGWTFGANAGGLCQGEDDTESRSSGPEETSPSSTGAPATSAGTEFDPGPSVDELANAMASLEDFEATAPADVAVSGYEGKRVALTVPSTPMSMPHPNPTPQAATKAITRSRVAAGIRRPARPTTCGSWTLMESASSSSPRMRRALRPTSRPVRSDGGIDGDRTALAARVTFPLHGAEPARGLGTDAFSPDAAASGSRMTTAVSRDRRAAQLSRFSSPSYSAHRAHRRGRSSAVAARPRTARSPSGSSTVVSGLAWRLSHQAGSGSPQPFMAMVTRFGPSSK